MKKAIILGNYGVGNLGDEDMLSRVISLVNAKGYSSVVCCGSPKKVSTIGIEVCRFLPSGLRSLIKWLWSKAYRTSIEVTKKQFNSSQTIIFGGGGLFVDTHWSAILLWWIHLRYAVKSKKHIVMLSQTFSISKRLSAFLCIPLLKKVALIAVRDRASQNLLKTFGIASQYLPDITFMREPEGKHPQILKKSVVLSLCKWGVDKQQREALVSVVKNLSVQGYTLIGTIFQSRHDNDYLVYQQLGVPMRLITHHHEILEAIQSADLLIGMRYHAIAMAIRCATPFVALMYQPKVANLLSDMDLLEQGIAIRKVNQELLQLKVNQTLITMIQSGGTCAQSALNCGNEPKATPPWSFKYSTCSRENASHQHTKVAGLFKGKESAAKNCEPG